MTTFAELVYAEMGAWGEADTSGDLEKFVQALCAPVEPIYARVAETDVNPAWFTLFDPATCASEDLDYLAQYAGVVVTPDMTEADKRAAITAPTGFARGTPAAIEATIQRTLTGTKRVVIYERVGGNAYQLAIRTLTTETPDEALTERVLRQDAKPAGLVLDYQAVDGQTYTDLDADYASYNAVNAAYASYDELADDLP